MIDASPPVEDRVMLCHYSLYVDAYSTLIAAFQRKDQARVSRLCASLLKIDDLRASFADLAMSDAVAGAPLRSNADVCQLHLGPQCNDDCWLCVSV